ncbi:MAG TPA: acyl-CoA dehydrogenase family protein [Solirubrobacteraceae bacterium]|jgi:alkylation response protein AidB-like acyl-CoA dehydrogenase|nr:acyl-CoA dehydrogenase family protein [Solirubrobacteraceae bacterium]
MPADTGYKEARAISEAAREKEWALPSFGKGLYLGSFQPELISPQPDLPAADVEKGERFLAALGRFLQEEVDPQVIERDNKIPDEVIAGFKEIGALGMKVPEQYGGLGLSQVYYNRAMMLIGTWHSSLSTLLSAHQSIGLAQPLLLFGSEEQKREWLPKVATTHVSAFALTEPDVGSDPARVTTTATPTEDGRGYLLNGRKLWTTNGTVADVLVVMAKVPRSDGHRGGITAFIVPSETEGVVVEARIEFMGLRGIENSQTRYTDAYVPAENVIGREGLGLKIALATLNTGRLALPAICAGVGKWATKIAREFASQRVQWGKPIGEHDEVAQRIAFIAATAFGLEAMLDVASRLADEKRNDVRIEAAIAKLYGSEMGWRIIDELMQVCGGRGYETVRSLQARGLRGVPVEQTMRDMRVNRIFEGSTEIMHLIIAREAMDQHLQVAGDLMEPELSTERKAKALGKAGAFYASWYPKLTLGRGQVPRSYADYGELAGEMRFVERASRKLARSTFYGMARWQAGTEGHGAFLGRIVDIGAELFAMSAAVVYAQTAMADHPERAAETQELAAAFCNQAQHRTERLFHELWNNADEANHRLALDVLSGRHTWLEAGILDPSAGDGPMVPSGETDSRVPVAALATP